MLAFQMLYDRVDNNGWKKCAKTKVSNQKLGDGGMSWEQDE